MPSSTLTRLGFTANRCRECSGRGAAADRVVEVIDAGTAYAPTDTTALTRQHGTE
jgi:hypothetical protein